MTDERITAYLLEELTEQESEQFEEQCFAQDEWSAELDAAEQELIDAYLRNELTSDRKQRFQERYLTTDARKARVLAAGSLHQTLCPVKSQSTWSEWLKTFFQRPLVPQAAAAVLVLAVTLGVLAPLAIRKWQGPETFTTISLEWSSPDRGGSESLSKLVLLPLATDALEIYLKLPPPQSPDTVDYRVQLEDANGPTGNLTIASRDGESLRVHIPASKLRTGWYILKLFEIKRDGTERRVSGGYTFEAKPR